MHLARIGARGCPMCRREADVRSGAARGAQGPSRSTLLVSAGGAVLVLALVWLSFRGSPSEAPVGLDLDPEAFREEIEAFESVLYAPGLDSRSREELRYASHRLHSALLDELGMFAGAPGPKPLLDFLWATGIEASVIQMPDRPAIRQRWEALRRTGFRQADWFAVGPLELDVAQASPSGRGIPADVAAYELTASRYQKLFTAFEVSMRDWPDSFSQADPQIAQRWSQAVSNVKFQLESIRRSFPGRPRRMNSSWVGAYTSLEEAEEAISKLFADSTTRNRIPNRTEMQGRFIVTRGKVARAVRDVERAPR